MNKPTNAREFAASRRVDVVGRDGSNADLTTMGGRITWARLRKEMTQDDLAKKLEKSRVTVVSYEGNKITPPIPQVENIAAALDVAPEFIAFGRQGIHASMNAEDEIVAVPEMTAGRDGDYQSSGYAIPRSILTSHGVEPKGVQMFVLDHPEPTFGYNAGDRLMVDTATTDMSPRFNIYLLRGDAGIGVARRQPNFGGAAEGMILLQSGDGSVQQVKVKDLDIVGAVVGRFDLSV